MKKIAKLALITGITLMFSGCFGSDSASDTTSTTAGKILTETDAFSMEYPETWEVMELKSLTNSNIPTSTLFAVRNNIIGEFFTANAAINYKDFEEEISSLDFAQDTIADAKKSLIDFTDISSDELKVAKGEEELDAYLAEFSGKAKASEPAVVFKQLYVVDGKTGYTVTAAHVEDEEESVIMLLDEMLNSFSLK